MLGDTWDRLDRWPLFEEPFLLVASHEHRLANRTTVALEDLRDERLVLRPYCDSSSEVLAVFRERGIAVENCDEITSDDDLVAARRHCGGRGGPQQPAGPRPSDPHPDRGLEVRRTVCLYGVAGRQRTAATTAILKMLRGADWSCLSG